jgi:hypothetical protein
MPTERKKREEMTAVINDEFRGQGNKKTKVLRREA